MFGGGQRCQSGFGSYYKTMNKSDYVIVMSMSRFQKQHHKANKKKIHRLELRLLNKHYTHELDLCHAYTERQS